MYRMTLQTMQALEEQQREQFCKTCLKDLKEDGFPTDPDDQKQLDQLVIISKRIEVYGYASESLQFRYFMLFTILGQEFLSDQQLQARLFNLETEDERCEYLELLIAANL